MKPIRHLLLCLAALFAVGLALPALAQPVAFLNAPHGTTTYVTPNVPLPVLSESFATSGSAGTLSATTASSNLLLPAAGSLIEVTNSGSVDAFVTIGIGSGTVATTQSYRVPAGQVAFLNNYIQNAGLPGTYIAGITASSTASLSVQMGNLQPGGGGGGGGSGCTAPCVVIGPTADGSAAATPPVLVAGTVDGTGTGLVGVLKVDGAGNSYILPGGITPTVPTTTLTTGGTAQNIAVTHGGYICNPLSTTDQGISPVEVIYVNIVTTATAVGNAGNSNITAGQCFNVPAGYSGNVSWIAATTGHKLNVSVW